MQHTYIDIRFEGKQFSPRKLKDLTGLPIEIITEYGEISTKGRYKGQASPYGLALLKINSKGLHTTLLEYSSLLADKKEALADSGVDEIIIDVETPPNTASQFSFDADLLSKLNTLNARIDFHTIEDEDDLETIFVQVEAQARVMIKNKIITEQRFRKFEQLLRKELLPDNLVQEPEVVYGSSRHSAFSILLYILKYIDEKDENIPAYKEVYRSFHAPGIE